MSSVLNLLGRARASYRDGRLPAAVSNRIRPYLQGIKYLFHNPAGTFVSLHAPDFVKPDEAELPAVKRIFDSFKKMKEHQTRVAQEYLPSEAWQSILDNAYAFMLSAIRDDDLKRFHYFLANCGCWEESLGFEGGDLIKKWSRSFLKRRYLMNDFFFKPCKVWDWHFGGRRDLAMLKSPMVGNKAGAFVQGTL